MLGLRVEQCTLNGQRIASDIAERIYGPSTWEIAIVAAHPAQMHAAIRKELQHIARSGNHASSGSTAASLHFSADALDRSLDARVTLATADEFLIAPPTCRTMYVTCPLDQLTLRRITSFMPLQALVVLYEGSTDS
jgi:hypothetical protein